MDESGLQEGGLGLISAKCSTFFFLLLFYESKFLLFESIFTTFFRGGWFASTFMYLSSIIIDVPNAGPKRGKSLKYLRFTGDLMPSDEEDLVYHCVPDS